MKSSLSGESWIGPDHQNLKNRIQKFPELNPSVLKVLSNAEMYLQQNPPGYEDAVDKISEEFFVGTHLANRKALEGKDPRFIVTAASYERAYKILSVVSNLGYAYRITRDKKYAKAAIRWMVNSARWPMWTHPGWMMNEKDPRIPITGEGECFATSTLLQTMAIGTELCFEEMVDHDLFEILGSVVKHARKVVDDYQTGRPWYFCFKAYHSNQFTIPVTSLGIAGAVFKQWAPEAERWLELGKKLTLKGLDAQSSDGAYAEGTAYANYGAKDYVLFAEVLASLGDHSLLRHPHLKNLPQWITDMTAPDMKRHVNVNDSRQFYWLNGEDPFEVSKSSLVMYGKQFLWYQRRYPNRGFGDYLLKVFGGLPESHWTLAWYDPSKKDKSKSKAFTGFRSYDVFGFHPWRGTIKKEEVLIGLVGGKYQKGHKHADSGSVLLYVGEDYLLSDSGVCPYSEPEAETYFKKAFAHNTITVDGKGQIEKSSASLLTQGKSGKWGWCVVESDSCYEDLSQFRRLLLFSTVETVFYVIDQGAFKDDGEHQLNWFWHTEGKIEIDKRAFTIKGKSHQLSIQSVSEIKGEIDVQLSLENGFRDELSMPRVKYGKSQRIFHSSFLNVVQFNWGESDRDSLARIRTKKTEIELMLGKTKIAWDGFKKVKIFAA